LAANLGERGGIFSEKGGAHAFLEEGKKGRGRVTGYEKKGKGRKRVSCRKKRRADAEKEGNDAARR